MFFPEFAHSPISSSPHQKFTSNARGIEKKKLQIKLNLMKLFIRNSYHHVDIFSFFFSFYNGLEMWNWELTHWQSERERERWREGGTEAIESLQFEDTLHLTSIHMHDMYFFLFFSSLFSKDRKNWITILIFIVFNDSARKLNGTAKI